MTDTKYIRIYSSIIYGYDDGFIVDLEISGVDEPGDSLGGKIGYDQFEYAEFVLNNEKDIFKNILSLREYDLMTFLKTPMEVDTQYKGFTSTTQYYINLILNGYVEEQYPELII